MAVGPEHTAELSSSKPFAAAVLKLVSGAAFTQALAVLAGSYSLDATRCP